LVYLATARNNNGERKYSLVPRLSRGKIPLAIALGFQYQNERFAFEMNPKALSHKTGILSRIILNILSRFSYFGN